MGRMSELQMELDDRAAMAEWYRQLYCNALIVLDMHPEDFDPTFRNRIHSNWPIFRTFYSKAAQMQKHRERYSARTLIEVIRWNTDLESSDTLFKINNNVTPDMARMYNRLTHTEFFEERKKL